MTQAADHIFTPMRQATTPTTTLVASGARASTVLLTGAGKSGSKRLLKIFDLSDQTHCRCEPHELPDTPWAQVPSGRVQIDLNGDEFRNAWSEAVAWSRVRLSSRDRVSGMPKRHVRRWAQRTQMYRIFRHHRLRNAMALLVPSIGGAEWEWPRMLGSMSDVRTATTVLKLGPNPGWACWVSENDPDARVISLVRHPAAFVNAYVKRWYQFQDDAAVTSVNRRLVQAIVRSGHHLPITEADIDRMSGVECELWSWRYLNEVLLEDARHQPTHGFIRDEDIVVDPIQTARMLFQFAGLEWTPWATTYLERMTPHWRDRMCEWRSVLDSAQVDLVERVLDGSPLAELWDSDERVSLFDYVAYA